MEERCIVCGEIIPEGRQICPQCEMEEGGANRKSIVCPYCGSGSGYYMIERVHRALYFNSSGAPAGTSEDVQDYTGKRKYCTDCYRILPRKMSEGRIRDGQKEKSIRIFETDTGNPAFSYWVRHRKVCF